MHNFFPRSEFITESRKAGHSNEFIHEALLYIDRLEQKNLPVIFSLKHLSEVIGVEYQTLNYLVRHRELYYSQFKLQKKRGGYRTIQIPSVELKSVQRWILRYILDEVPLHPSSFGFVKNRSIKDNAFQHAGNEAVLKIDLCRFFDTITERRVYGLFRELGYEKNVAVDLTRLVTTYLPNHVKSSAYTSSPLPWHGGACLPQGAPTSPAIANLIAKRLDFRLNGLARKLGVVYTRYADDITFSGPLSSLPQLSVVKTIIKDEGFAINPAKTSTRIRGQRQIVTGLTITDGVHVPKKYKQDIRKHLYYCKKYGPENHIQKIGFEHSFFKEWLLGRIWFVGSIEPEVGVKMMDDFNQIPWPM